MKPIVALDLSLFAIPSTAESSSDVQDILGRVRAWASAIDKQNCITFATLSDVVDVLRSANCFPATQQIGALLQLHDLEHVFSAKDINTRLFSILQKAQRLSEVMGFEVIELESCDISGTDVTKSPDVAILKSLACLAASVAVFEHSDLVRISTAFPCCETVNIEGRITLIEVGGQLEERKMDVKKTVRAVRGPDDYLSSLAAGTIWEHAEDPIQLHLAISLEIANAHNLPLRTLPLKDVPGFCIGSEFLLSLRAHHGLAKGTLANLVRSKCAQVIVSKPQAEPRSFGSCRRDDSADSFRVHLSKDHAAFRLMYWTRPDGEIEFANVGVKHALEICEGDFRAHAASRYS